MRGSRGRKSKKVEKEGCNDNCHVKSTGSENFCLSFCRQDNGSPSYPGTFNFEQVSDKGLAEA